MVDRLVMATSSYALRVVARRMMRSSASSYRARAVARSESAARAVARRRGGRVPARGGAGVGRRDARADRASVAELEANAPVRDADAMVVRAVRERRYAAEDAEGDERARGESSPREGTRRFLRRAPRRCLRRSRRAFAHTGVRNIHPYGGQSRFFIFGRDVASWQDLERTAWRSQFSRELRDRRRPSLRRNTRPAPRRRSPLTTARIFRD